VHIAVMFQRYYLQIPLTFNSLSNAKMEKGRKINGTALTSNVPKQTSKSYNLKLQSSVATEIILENFNEFFMYVLLE
jgi:hypothetical protein